MKRVRLILRGGHRMGEIHPFYQAHRGAMEAAMRQRLDLAEAMLRERAHLSNLDKIRQDVMDEFEIVLTQMPYVGGAASRMSDFFMRSDGLYGHRPRAPATRRVAVRDRRYRARKLQGAIAHRARGRTARFGASIHVVRRTNPCCASRLQKARQKEYPEDFVYDFVEPGPGDSFEFGIDYKACGFCKFAARHGDKEILPTHLRT